MLDLDRRLHDTARRATADLTIDDPTGAPSWTPELVPAPRRTARRAAAWTAGVAASVALIAAGGWLVASDPSPARLDAAGPGEVAPAGDVSAPTSGAPAARVDPAVRLQSAIDATLSSESFRVRTATVVPRSDQSLGSRPELMPLPSVVGDGRYGDMVTTVVGDREASSWTAGHARTIRESATDRTFWETDAGVWQSAILEDVSFVEQLRALAASNCVVGGEDQTDGAAGGGTQLVVITGTGPCTDGVAPQGASLRQHWKVDIGSDGRLASIVPVRDDELELDERSDQIFEGYDTWSVELPDPAAVTEVPTPEGSYIDGATGYSRPMFSKG